MKIPYLFICASLLFTISTVEGKTWKIDVDTSKVGNLVVDAKTVVPRAIKSLLQYDPSLEPSRYLAYGVLLEADSPTSWSWSLVGFMYENGRPQWDFHIDHAIVVVSVFSGFEYEAYPQKRMVWVPVKITE